MDLFKKREDVAAIGFAARDEHPGPHGYQFMAERLQAAHEDKRNTIKPAFGKSETT